MKKIFILLIIILMFIISCKELYEVQYFGQYIDISGYEAADYLNLLYSPNKEIINNSIIAIMLMGENNNIIKSYDSTDDSEINKINKKILERILELLNHKDQKIVTSSIRFIRVGIENLDKNNIKKLLIEKIMKVKSTNINVKYEQINALASLVDKDTQINIKFIRRFINDKSWLVSRSSYKIIDSLENNELRGEIISKYKKTNEQFEKIILLGALKTNFNDDIFNFYKNELSINQDSKIRKNILSILKYANNKKLALKWINNNDNILSKDDVLEISNSCYEDVYGEFSFDLFLLLLNKDIYPNDFASNEKEPRLFSSLIQGKKDNIDKFKIIDKILLSKKDIKDKWIIYKTKNDK